MKYHIDTIPVWDALHANSECPLCALRRKTERLLVERNLGAAVMSPDTRLKVNEKGFCTHHQAMMYNQPGGNRLGHGLMMLSHLQTLRPKLERELGKPGLSGRAKPGLARIFSRAKDNQAERTRSPLSELAGDCLICDELLSQSQRQAASLLHLWKTDKTFRDAFTQSKGLCLPHTDFTTSMADELLTGETLEAYVKTVRTLLSESLARLEEELNWFAQKFDYRNAQKPWGTSRDALERTVNKLRGWCLGSEPMQDEP
ncbi:MAG: DUF6062 family protein [Christensenellales bacterium]|jgi:hypothetical protein